MNRLITLSIIAIATLPAALITFIAQYCGADITYFYVEGYYLAGAAIQLLFFAVS